MRNLPKEPIFFHSLEEMSKATTSLLEVAIPFQSKIDSQVILE